MGKVEELLWELIDALSKTGEEQISIVIEDKGAAHYRATMTRQREIG